MVVILYILIFAGMIIEGEAVLFLAFYFATRGYFDFIFIIPIVVLGVLIGDALWYRFGISIGSTFFGRLVCSISKPFDNYLIARPKSAIFISKFTYGLGHAAIMRAGILKTPFKEFFKADAVASFFWIALIGGLAYVSATTFGYFKQYLKFAEIGLLIGLVILFIFATILSEINRKRFKKFVKIVNEATK